ncbi:hypothetical protein L1987_23390 [Smallanthus sonchifolius]|uniref:Uncharacterized protein n=1 Tax=Smallanthus sonchifolius TaxID=185202 RepID=A0ACB9IK52_9ASTR|nr:hypothetical protein L1987_23390 [Smallanthus sonchifolius]
MGALSRLTGDARFEHAALKALHKLWGMRSSLNLLGTTLDVATGEWIEYSSGIGAGVDSFYEYLLKAHILFGKEEFWRMFHSAYLAVQKYFRYGSWYHEADMRTGRATYWQLTSLQAFWPGVQKQASAMSMQVCPANLLNPGHGGQEIESVCHVPDLLDDHICLTDDDCGIDSTNCRRRSCSMAGYCGLWLFI